MVLKPFLNGAFIKEEVIMMKLPKKVRLDLYRLFEHSDVLDQLQTRGSFMEALSSVWDLRLMSSTDHRFKDLASDLTQHFINNKDWDTEELFLNKLGLIDDDKTELFVKFLEMTVGQNWGIDDDVIKELVSSYNDLLKSHGYEIFTAGYNDKYLPIYKFKEIEIEKDPIDIALNSIPFFVDKAPTGHTLKTTSHKSPPRKPAFVLVFDFGWNDYDIYTRFALFYHTEDSVTLIGEMKLFKTDESWDSNGYYYTEKYLPDEFVNLDIRWCSLGKDSSYYIQLKELFPDNYKSILWALKDSAMFPYLEDRYGDNPIFRTSLIRDDLSERMLRLARPIMSGEDPATMFNFTYKFTPRYAEKEVEFAFDFSNKGFFPNRMYAVIGENGVGKTQMISLLPLDLSQRRITSFEPKIPQFSKIIAVSYSQYDHFEIPETTASFNYYYSGLFKDVGGKRVLCNRDDLQSRLFKNCHEIIKKSRIQDLNRILSNLFPKEKLEGIFIQKDEKTVLAEAYVAEWMKDMSSGEVSFLFVFSDILANIRFDSLILFDEPENHLHPSAITSLINAISELLDTYQSFSIVVTHSPLIVRELLSKNVYVMSRYVNTPDVKRIGIESFGENIATLNTAIFGKDGVQPYFRKRIKSIMQENGFSYQQMAKLLESDGLSMSLNTSIYIKSIERKANEED